MAREEDSEWADKGRGGGEEAVWRCVGGWTERADGESGGGGKRKQQPVSERRVQSCSLAPGATFLSAMASLSAKCTFDASPRMLLEITFKARIRR